MKKILLVALALGIVTMAKAQKTEIVKTGYNFGPLPLVAFDADKGLQVGALLNIYNYGDGSSYPNYKSKAYLEASYFTKGSQLYQLMYDNKSLIPGIRWSSSASMTIDKAMDFYGFNGYGAWFDQEKDTPYYRVDRIQLLAKSDFIGDIIDNLKWEAGYHFGWFREGTIDRDNINKGKSEDDIFPDDEPTLYELYRTWGLISDDEADGGIVSSVRLGLVYDTRDKEGAPSKGIWAEGHVTLAPKWLGTTNPFYRYSLTMRQYFPLVKNDVLTFAYRLNYEGTMGSSAPYYVLPYITVMGENGDKDGMGGYRTVRGILRDRVVGLDMATYTAELRWRFTHFTLGKQNIALGLNAFSDGTMVTRGRDMSYNANPWDDGYVEYEKYQSYMANGHTRDIPHVTAGMGFRFIMNQNFIAAVEYGTPITHFYSKTNSIYNQDGTGAFYVNIGYLF